MTLAFLSLLSARTALRSSATVSMTSERLPPALLPSSIILNVLSRFFDFRRSLIDSMASSNVLPIFISITALFSSSYRGPSPCRDTSSRADSRPTPARRREAICLRKSGVDCSMASTRLSIIIKMYAPSMIDGRENPTSTARITLKPRRAATTDARTANMAPPRNARVTISDAFTYSPVLMRVSCSLRSSLSGIMFSRASLIGFSALGTTAISTPHSSVTSCSVTNYLAPIIYNYHINSVHQAAGS